jgi:hypothetical protein
MEIQQVSARGFGIGLLSGGLTFAALKMAKCAAGKDNEKYILPFYNQPYITAGIGAMLLANVFDYDILSAASFVHLGTATLLIEFDKNKNC